MTPQAFWIVDHTPRRGEADCLRVESCSRTDMIGEQKTFLTILIRRRTLSATEDSIKREGSTATDTAGFPYHLRIVTW